MDNIFKRHKKNLRFMKNKSIRASLKFLKPLCNETTSKPIRTSISLLGSSLKTCTLPTIQSGRDLTLYIRTHLRGTLGMFTSLATLLSLFCSWSNWALKCLCIVGTPTNSNRWTTIDKIWSSMRWSGSLRPPSQV